MNNWLDQVKFDDQGLIPAIAQDHQTGRILMVAWMNREALLETVKTQRAVYFSRSRQKLWRKGEESGHSQQVHEIRLDCDGDVITLMITQHGGIACHTGRQSCFYRVLDANQNWQTVDPVLKNPDKIYHKHSQHIDAEDVPVTEAIPVDTAMQTDVLPHLAEVMQQRKQADADQSYVASLYRKGINKILEKVGEEAVETIIAAKDFDHQRDDLTLRQDLIGETADLWFHSIIMLGHFDLSPQDILNELARRQGLSGLVEKANRSQS